MPIRHINDELFFFQNEMIGASQAVLILIKPEVYEGKDFNLLMELANQRLHRVFQGTWSFTRLSLAT